MTRQGGTRHGVPRQDGPALADVVAGALAGALGVWALDRVDWFLYRREPAASRLRTRAVRPGGEDPAHVAATRLEHRLGWSPTPAQHHAAGTAIHYLIGVAPTIAYALMRKRQPALTKGRGALYGLSAFLLADEAMGPLLGLAAPPHKYPWQPHARSGVAHVVLGLVIEAALREVDRRRAR